MYLCPVVSVLISDLASRVCIWFAALFQLFRKEVSRVWDDLVRLLLSICK